MDSRQPRPHQLRTSTSRRDNPHPAVSDPALNRRYRDRSGNGPVCSFPAQNIGPPGSDVRAGGVPTSQRIGAGRRSEHSWGVSVPRLRWSRRPVRVRVRCGDEYARNVAEAPPASHPSGRTEDAPQELCADDVLGQLERGERLSWLVTSRRGRVIIA
jgi:hypothetical protein